MHKKNNIPETLRNYLAQSESESESFIYVNEELASQLNLTLDETIAGLIMACVNGSLFHYGVPKIKGDYLESKAKLGFSTKPADYGVNDKKCEIISAFKRKKKTE
jgi:hypothetical protein